MLKGIRTRQKFSEGCKNVGKHLTNIINNHLFWTKLASVRPTFKKGERKEIGNYRPVSILNCFFKIYERFLHD